MVRYEINGSVIEFDQEPSEADIDEAAASLGPKKQAAFQPPQNRNFYDNAGLSFSPEEQVQHPYLSAINKTGQDVATVGGNFANQFSLNHLRSLLNQHGIDFPEAQTVGAKIAAPVAGVGGAIASPAGKLIGGATKAVKGAGVGLKALTGSAAGAASGAAYAPESGVGDIGARIGQAGAGAALGGALPVAGAGIQKGIQGIKKGAEYLAKSSADYVTTKVAPRAYQIYQDSVQRFTPQIQKFAEEKLKIPASAIETIKNKGVENIKKVRESLGDTTDSIVQRLNDQIEQFRKAADFAQQKAFQSAPEGKQIDIRPAIEEAGNRLKRLGLVTERGKLTELGESEIARDSVYGKLLDFYRSADSISGVKGLQGRDLTQGQMIKATKAMKETLVNKDQYAFLRDKLNDLYKNRPSDVNVSKVVNQFYDDGERSGIVGLQEARKLTRQAFDLEKNYKKLVQEKSFDKFHGLPKEKIRQLQELEEKLGVPFIEDLKALSTGKYLDKLNEYNPAKFKTDLDKAVLPKWTKTIYEEYKDLLGEGPAKQIFNEIVAHRRGLNIKAGGKIVGGGAAGALGAGTIYGAAKGFFGQ